MSKKTLAVYNIVETNRDKPLWNRIGTAFANRDGSFNVLLNALPVDGKLHIRESKQNGEGQTRESE